MCHSFAFEHAQCYVFDLKVSITLQDAVASNEPKLNVISQLDTHLEMVPVAPKLHQLNELLQVVCQTCF